LTKRLASGRLLAYGGCKGEPRASDRLSTPPVLAVRNARGRRRHMHGTEMEAAIHGGRALVTQRQLGRPELADAAMTLRRLLLAVRAHEVGAPADVVARLEGAVIALDAVATGKTPETDDLLSPGPYTI
jgi:hypothetical protein